MTAVCDVEVAGESASVAAVEAPRGPFMATLGVTWSLLMV